jgi:hypothetical protein
MDHRRNSAPPGAGGDRCRRDRGEGVISAAIAVLIVAFIGAAMWVGFTTIWENAESDIGDQIDSIGAGG